jgi:cell division protein FtsW
MRRGELESRILILVTLALVAFGIVCVYSATSAPAAVGGGNPNYFVERQGLYALLGIVLMVLAQRWDYRRLRALAPALVVSSLALLAAVLVIGPAINGARRWIAVGPAVFQPSELAKLSLAVWAAAHLSRRPAPRTLKQLARPIGLLAGVYALLLLAEPLVPLKPRRDRGLCVR